MIDFHTYVVNTRALWEKTRAKNWDYPEVSEEIKLSNEAKMDAFMEKARIEKTRLSMLDMNPMFDLTWLNPEQKALFHAHTMTFLKDAKAFDDTLQDEEIFQALRNLWIFFMLQMIFGKTILYHDAIFAYSMLYPYSDNFLDQHANEQDAKRQFNDWFTDRLHGKCVPLTSPLLEKIDALVGRIEKVFDREANADVYESLYHIQNAQIQSQRQANKLSLEELCEIAITKGGASVLADGFLMDGKLTHKQMQFCMCFGYMLQIADDLQDMKEDRLQHQYTLANCIEGEAALENLFLQALSFLEKSMDVYSECDDCIKAFIYENTRHMMSASVLPYADAYSPKFYTKVCKSLPVHPTYMQKIMQMMRHHDIANMDVSS